MVPRPLSGWALPGTAQLADEIRGSHTLCIRVPRMAAQLLFRRSVATGRDLQLVQQGASGLALTGAVGAGIRGQPGEAGGHLRYLGIEPSKAAQVPRKP